MIMKDVETTTLKEAIYTFFFQLRIYLDSAPDLTSVPLGNFTWSTVTLLTTSVWWDAFNVMVR